jgi:hypothetical protein
MRLLILACSRRKTPGEEPMPAWLRYAGPLHQTLRKWQREAGAQLGVDLDVAILSARHGLIAWDQPIASYNERMTIRRAEAHRAQVTQELGRLLARRPEAICVCVGAVYWRALPELSDVTTISGGLGVRAGQLKRWFWDGVTPAAPGGRLERQHRAASAPVSLS